LFSTRTSLVLISLWKIALPRGAFRSSVMLRLLRFALMKNRLSLSAVNGATSRVKSPLSRRSILMTSAPRAPSSQVQ
jgi:hypothetical protein